MKYVLLILSLCVAINPVHGKGFPVSVEVFMVQGHAVTGGDLTDQMNKANVPLTVYDLSQARQFNTQLSQGIPRDPALAQQHIKGILAQSPDAIGIYAQTLIGQQRARRLDIRYVPAIVFDDGQSVVYGITDMDYALQIYRRAQ